MLTFFIMILKGIFGHFGLGRDLGLWVDSAPHQSLLKKGLYTLWISVCGLICEFDVPFSTFIGYIEEGNNEMMMMVDRNHRGSYLHANSFYWGL